MKEHQSIFSVKELKSKIKKAFVDGIPNQDEKIKLIENWQENISSGKVATAKEEEIKPLFLTLFFGDVLGYEYKNATDWNLRLENKSSLDSSKADAALGFFKIKDKQELDKDVRVVIEIKDARTTLDKPQNRPDFKGSAVEQCFMYAAKSGEKCKWVVVSNFLEIRLYLANDMTKYESFDILTLNDKYEFSRFYYLLANGQLFFPTIASSIDDFLATRQEKEKNITKEFYEKYQYLREVFLQHLKLHNPDKNPLDLLQYAQTIIDRILFVSVIKDYDLIHYDVLKRIEKLADESYAKDKGELWRQIKNLFEAIDEGLPPRIHKFNGGLFRGNEVISKLTIKDLFLKELLALSNYDFESDLNVNILGHIFEQSITDIENLKRDITENKQFEYSETDDEIIYKSHILETNKRKKQGIYYTPEKITFYIVSNAIGSWLEEQKERIGINQLTDFPNNTEERDKHIELWEQYKIALKSVKILDPACGSGAFLTQAFDFLLHEWLIVLDVIQNLKNEKIKIKEKGLFQSMPQENAKLISKIKKEIVNNNLFGVDLNHESVEITKLGLWLKSASKNDALALLDTNIKCGNSLISDKEVSEKAFDWNIEFSEIIEKNGFDIVIGNPPYIRPHNIADNEKVYLWNKYEVAQQKTDIYSFFIEKGLELIKENGILSFIVPKTWFSIFSFEKLRKYVLENTHLQLIGILPTKVFDDAVVETTIIKLQKNNQNNQLFTVNIADVFRNKIIKSVSQNEYLNHPSHNITTENYSDIWKNTVKLGDITEIIVGIATGDDKKYCRFEKLTDLDKPAIRGANVSKYFIDYKGEYLWYDREQMVADSNLKPKSSLKLALGQCSPKQPSDFEIPEKIVMQRIAKKLIAALDTQQFYAHTSLVIIKPIINEFSLKYILAVLNSELINYWLKSNTSNISLNVSIIKNIPIKNISSEKQSWFVDKVNKINELTAELYKQKNSFVEIVKSQLKVGKINRKIDDWYNLDWQEFTEELDKLKVKLDLKKVKEWNIFFNSEQKNVKPLAIEIKEIIQAIDKKIYEIYEISTAEINEMNKKCWF